MLAGAGDRGDALADQRLARRALDPAQDAVGAGLPAEAFGRLGLDDGARGLEILLLVPAIGLDPLDQLADLRIRAAAPAPWRGCGTARSRGRGRWRRTRPAPCSTSGGRSRRWRSRARAAGPSRGSTASHSPRLEPGAGDQRRRDRRHCPRRRRRAGRARRQAGQRARRLAADGGSILARLAREEVEGAAGFDLAVVAAGAGRAGRRAAAIAPPAGRAGPPAAPAPSRSCRRIASRLRPSNARHARSKRNRRAGTAKGPNWSLPCVDAPKRDGIAVQREGRRLAPTPLFLRGVGLQVRLDSQSSQKLASSARGPVTARNAASASARWPAIASAAPSRVLTMLASAPFCSAAR